jgi:hypothetical protein
MAFGLCFLYLRDRHRRANGYKELAQVEVIGSENRKNGNLVDDDDSIYFHKGIGM